MRAQMITGWILWGLLWLLLAEAAARWLAPFDLIEGEPVFVLGEFGGGTEMLEPYRADGVDLWRRAYPGRRPPAPAKQGTRVVVIGDSILVPDGVRAPQGALMRLDDALARFRQGPPVEIVNLTQGGFNTVQEEVILRRQGLPLDPDLVVVAMAPNDNREFALQRGRLLEVRFLRSLLERGEQAPGLPWLYRHSYLANWIWVMWQKLWWDDASEHAWDREMEANLVLAPLTRMHAAVQAAGARLALICFPRLGGTLDAARDGCAFPQVTAWAASVGVPLFDPIPVYARYDLTGIRLNDIHLNERGHQILAAALFDWVTSAGLVPVESLTGRPEAPPPP